MATAVQSRVDALGLAPLLGESCRDSNCKYFVVEIELINDTGRYGCKAR